MVLQTIWRTTVAPSADLLPGTLELLVLKALSLEPMHGWGIGQRIDQLSRDVFKVQQGSLYPALQRMLRKGWIRSEWRPSENGRAPGTTRSLPRAGDSSRPRPPPGGAPPPRWTGSSGCGWPTCDRGP